MSGIVKDTGSGGLDVASIGDKIVETLYSNRVTSENKRIHTLPLPSPFKVGVLFSVGSSNKDGVEHYKVKGCNKTQ